jgi:plasmid stabilization system protein ParE
VDLASVRYDLSILSPQAADRLPATLLRRALALADHPRMGRVIPEFGNPLLRELIEGGYRILYEVFPDRVEVWGVAYGREQLVKPPPNP